jgi:hypothetical protein
VVHWQTCSTFYQPTGPIYNHLASYVPKIEIVSLKKCTSYNIPWNVRATLDSVGPSLPINTMEYSSNLDPFSNLKFLPSFVSSSASVLLIEVASSETITLGKSSAMFSMMDSGKEQIKDHTIYMIVCEKWFIFIRDILNCYTS